MVLWARPNPDWFPTNIPYTPMDNTHLYSIPSVRLRWGSCYCLGIAPDQLLKKSTWLLHLIGDKGQPAACDSTPVKPNPKPAAQLVFAH